MSTVEGSLWEDATLSSILEATFPGGSVTGAPKIAALDQIARLEPIGRGASMGCGCVDPVEPVRIGGKEPARCR